MSWWRIDAREDFWQGFVALFAECTRRVVDPAAPVPVRVSRPTCARAARPANTTSTAAAEDINAEAAKVAAAAVARELAKFRNRDITSAAEGTAFRTLYPTEPAPARRKLLAIARMAKARRARIERESAVETALPLTRNTNAQRISP